MSEFEEATPHLLRLMQMSRECDRREGILLRQGRGWFHVAGAGHEAQVALGFLLSPNDLVFSYYRDRAIALSRGVPLAEMARLFFARAEGVSAGRNMPCHLSWRKGGLFSVTTPTGAQCLPSAGAAWGQMRDGQNGVTVCLIGDAATRQGEFFEAVCLAVQVKLPVLFYVEDNGYGISTPTRETTPLALGVLPPFLVTLVDGSDPKTVWEVGGCCLQKMREGGGPHILWASLDRLGPHTSSDDERVYRPEAELSGRRDPINRLAERLIERSQMTASEWERMREQVEAEVKAAYSEAETEDEPSATFVTRNVLQAPDAMEAPPLPNGGVGNLGGVTMREAVNLALSLILAGNPKTLLWGQDIADPKGGVFGLTRGLSSKYPDRVANAPLAEATILGAAAGLAATGYLPVFELQFIDFLGPAFNQLVSQVANIRWRSDGEWTCPSVFYAPCGAYLPAGGMWHSQSGEGLLAHIHGVRVAMPSNPQDAFNLFWNASQLRDPTFILLPKSLLHVRVSEALRAEPAPPGVARMVRSGNDVTVVAWGNTVSLALEAASIAANADGIEAEVIDLRWLYPWDRAAVADSLQRTGRLLVVQEDTETASLGQAIIASVTTDSDSFFSLRTSPRLLARPDTPMPFSPVLEKSLLPSAATILQALREMARE